MQRWGAAIVGVLLAGCVSAQSGAPSAQGDEPVSVEPSRAAGYDYLVTIRDTPNRSFDPSNQAARDRAALAALKNQCDQPQVTGETIIKSNGFLQGSEIRRYEIKVRC